MAQNSGFGREAEFDSRLNFLVELHPIQKIFSTLSLDTFFFITTIQCSHHNHRQCVLPKGRSFTASSGTQACSSAEGMSSTANSGTKCAVLLGLNRCGRFSVLSAPTLYLASEQTLKQLKRSQGHQRGVRRVDLANWALWTSSKFTTGIKYQFHQGF